mmetsp:Transcript_21893/g.46804  ORF Transcript_21893/g.46804 Transcript_21893/m.46804 type:complete len:134 (+) Transcript_21893:233-634(+)|eukprot:CAMPEP_0206605584 /NCGR_PEP_ID=MMETSP0325_2-20121206/50540_1 /ASSEMBLY_ACC=CAM_ASM_000347 /TAXON_ID=2866 /ORGANISM="Crypthecodinium cohnii, Strain Seligo" /LENGTH=133 /DNA_ID=CAMNT_0054121231 /DNA_START=455 /DNA_END=856 /DNA_ORIENTATION=+
MPASNVGGNHEGSGQILCLKLSRKNWKAISQLDAQHSSTTPCVTGRVKVTLCRTARACTAAGSAPTPDRPPTFEKSDLKAPGTNIAFKIYKEARQIAAEAKKDEAGARGHPETRCQFVKRPANPLHPNASPQA